MGVKSPMSADSVEEAGKDVPSKAKLNKKMDKTPRMSQNDTEFQG